jgi:hypothetical protein
VVQQHQEPLGVVYILSEADRAGTDQIAEQSAWTVIVARQLQLKGLADLVINRKLCGVGRAGAHGVGQRQHRSRLSN